MAPPRLPIGQAPDSDSSCALARPLHPSPLLPCSVQVQSRRSPCLAAASYLGLADAQVGGGPVQPLLLFNALLDRYGREDAVTGGRPGACGAGVRDV